jgi:EmrB/QacA subfamily drug resistance transporter
VEHRYRVFLVCVTGIFITVFDTSSAIVALPTIAAQLSTDLPTAQWVIIGNSLTIAALLVPMGRLADMIGRKRIYVIGCGLFATGATLAWLSNSIYLLIGARCLVGVGSAMTQGTAMAILVSNFEANERGKMLGLQMAGVGFGAIAGPALGGLVVGTIGWPMLFALSALLMLAVGVAGQRILRRRPRRPASQKEPFDVWGALLFSFLLVAGLLALTLGPSAGWHAPGSLAGAALFVALLIAFIAVERTHAAPMLDFALFRNPAFALGATAALVFFMSVSCTRFLSPFFFQGVKGFDASEVGLLILPGAVTTAILAPFAGRLADRFGVRLFANAGFSIALCGLIGFCFVEPTTSTFLVVASLVIISVGMSAFGAPNSAAILNSVDSSTYGFAAGFVNLCRNTGNIIGIAFGTAIVSLTMANAGLAPSLSEVSVTTDSGVFVAFTQGVRTAAIALLCLAVPVLTIVVAWSLQSHRTRRERALAQKPSD